MSRGSPRYRRNGERPSGAPRCRTSSSLSAAVATTTEHGHLRSRLPWLSGAGRAGVASPITSDKVSYVWSLEPVLPGPKLKRLLSAIEHGQDGVSHGLPLDGSLCRYPSRVCIRLQIHNLVGVAIHDDASSCVTKMIWRSPLRRRNAGRTTSNRYALSSSSSGWSITKGRSSSVSRRRDNRRLTC